MNTFVTLKDILNIYTNNIKIFDGGGINYIFKDPECKQYRSYCLQLYHHGFYVENTRYFFHLPSDWENCENDVIKHKIKYDSICINHENITLSDLLLGG